MTALILPRRFTQQPQGLVEIDWTNPLTSRLVLANNLNSCYDAATNKRPLVSGAAQAFGPYSGKTFSGANARVDYGQTSVIPGGSSTHTVCALAYWKSTGRGIAFSQSHQSFPYPSTDLAYGVNASGASADGLITFYEFDGSMQASATAGAGSADNKLHFVCGVRNGAAANTRIYIDGVDRTTAPAGSGNTINASTQFLSLGNEANYSGTDRVFTVPLFLVLTYSRVLSDIEIKELSANPWQIFKPSRQVLYFDVGGGNTPSAADAGAITLTGSAANGVRALAGVAASGSIALTGSAANAVRALAGVAASGSITLTGSNAAALRTWLGVAGAGSITLTGSDAAGVKAGSGAYASAADAGSITLSGSAAIGTYDRLAAAGSGSITLTGSDASGIRNIPATAEAGSIVLTGSAAVGIRTWLAAAEAGSITLSGSDAEGVFGGAMTLTQADLDAIAAAVWADPAAVAAHAKLDAIIARITC